MHASRIADLLETFGVNTFSSLDANSNVWGSWPADYSPANVKRSLAWLTGDCAGLTIGIREYHYASREAMQAEWLDQVCQSPAVGNVTLCIGANGSADHVPSMLRLASVPERHITMLEGVNEPNTNFGSGVVPPATTIAAQKMLREGFAGTIAGPSVVCGLPYPEGYIVPGYLNPPQMRSVRAAMTAANAHIYLPSLPDLNNGAGVGAMDDFALGIRQVYACQEMAVTEWHPTLYNSHGVAPGGATDAYYGLLSLLAFHRLGVLHADWYALNDYGQKADGTPIYRCGLFGRNVTEPRSSAWMIRALFKLCADPSRLSKREFTPEALDFDITGLEPPIDTASPHTGGQCALFQAAAGTFFLFVWNAQVAYGGTAADHTVTFAKPPNLVKVYDPCRGSAALQPIAQFTNPAAVALRYGAAVRLLVIQP